MTEDVRACCCCLFGSVVFIMFASCEQKFQHQLVLQAGSSKMKCQTEVVKSVYPKEFKEAYFLNGKLKLAHLKSWYGISFWKYFLRKTL